MLKKKVATTRDQFVVVKYRGANVKFFILTGGPIYKALKTAAEEDKITGHEFGYVVKYEKKVPAYLQRDDEGNVVLQMYDTKVIDEEEEDKAA